MNRKRSLRRAALAAALVLALAGPARAACTFSVLADTVEQATTGTPAFYQFTQSYQKWSVVGVRPQPGEDWDLGIYSSTAADPTCVTGKLASSTQGVGALDFVAADFDHSPLGTYYVATSRYSGAGQARVEWDNGWISAIIPNTEPYSGGFDDGDLLRVYPIDLTAGVTYNFDFFPDSGLGAHLLLLRNPGSGAYWTARGFADFDVTASTSYTAPSSGWYGVVITNDAAGSGLYTLGVTTAASGCGIPTTLAAQVPVTFPSPGATVAFFPSRRCWMGCATRANSGDWDLGMYGEQTGGDAPTCLSTQLATSSYGAGAVDLVVGDFDYDFLGPYFARASMYSGAGSGEVEFTGSQGTLTINDATRAVTLATTDLAQMYDVHLVAGRTYALSFSAPAGMSMLLFANASQYMYFAGRANAVASSSTSTTYTATVTGWYGLAVVNDGAVAGTYNLGVGDCSQVTALTSDVAVSTGALPNAYYAIEPQYAYWTVVGVRNSSTDWDLVASADSARSPWPACATTPLANSSGVEPRQDFIVGDMNYDPLGRYYFRAHQAVSGAVSAASVQWHESASTIIPDDNNLASGITGSGGIVSCWDVWLDGGSSYEFDLAHSGGGDLKLCLFRNASSGVYWAGRSAAVFEATATQAYTAPASGFYGVVVVNDNGAADDYTVAVKTCPAITALSPLPAVATTTAPLADVSFTQTAGYWTPVAVVAAVASNDYDLYVYSQGSGGDIGTCLDGLLAYSNLGAGQTDFVVGNFNRISLGTYYAQARRWTGVGLQGATLAYYPGSQTLALGATVIVNPPEVGLVRSWDARLVAGQSYTLLFSHAAGLDAKIDVFAPGGSTWLARNAALVEGSQSVQFTAATTGWYGIVVVVDGGSGSYALELRQGLVAVDDPAPRPAHDALVSIAPNPGRAGLHIDFALHDGGEPAFEVLDMAGRRVATFAPGARGSGTWSLGWHASDDAGRPLPAGLYFVRMRLGERVVGSRKLTLLE